MNSKLLPIFFLAISHTLTNTLMATELSPLEKYQRCFSQLTLFPIDMNALTSKRIQDGQIDPIEACITMLNNVTFPDGKTEFEDSADTKDRAIVESFHRLHASWFSNQKFPAAFLDKVFDAASPASYFSLAFFGNLPVYSVWTSQIDYRPVRLERGQIEKTSGFDDIPMPDNAHFLGVRPETIHTWNYIVEGLEGPLRMRYHFGGGFLGSSIYHLSIYRLLELADGGQRMPRKFGRDLFSDVFCRQLPVVRKEDVIQYVQPESPISFRQKTGCVHCHASMDQLSGLLRNFEVEFFNRAIELPKYLEPTLPSDFEWPSQSDPMYANKPNSARLIYRDYSGNLLSKEVTGFPEFGNLVATLDDPYICIAKRYYHYFLGYDIDISDPRGKVFSTEYSQHRDTVVNLGKQLKVDQSLKGLIVRILKLPQYSQADFSIPGGSQ